MKRAPARCASHGFQDEAGGVGEELGGGEEGVELCRSLERVWGMVEVTVVEVVVASKLQLQVLCAWDFAPRRCLHY